MLSTEALGVDGEAPPPLRLLAMICGKWASQAISAAAEMGIADALREGPQAAAQVARAVGASEDGTYRLMRALSSLGILEELDGRRFALSEIGQFLRSDMPGSMRGYARFLGYESNWRVWGALEHAVRTGEPGYDRVYGMSAFEYADKHPEAAEVLNEGMTSVSQVEAAQVAGAYDFSAIGTLVDVGGGHGFLLATILEANPGMRGVLFDMAHAVDGAHELLGGRGLLERCAVASGSFLDGVPRGDACILKHIVHDWDDERSTKILRNCRDAMPRHGRVLVVETVVPPLRPHFGKLLDLEMLVLTPGGRERTEEEFRSLFRGAGLRLERVVPTGGFVSVIEGVPG
jgi:hypothetical protein